jgi:hypothetical protein
MPFSVSTWRQRPSRPAPSAVRTASSRSRASARARRRFARLVHAMSSMHAAAPTSASNARRALRRHFVAQPVDRRTRARIFVRIRVFQLGRNRRHLGCRLLHRDALFQLRDDMQVVVVPVGVRLAIGASPRSLVRSSPPPR